MPKYIDAALLYFFLGYIVWEIRHLRIVIEALPGVYASKDDTEKEIVCLKDVTNNHEHRITVIETGVGSNKFKC